MTFFKSQCVTRVDFKEFGIRDDLPNQPACVDEVNKEQWLAHVNNEHGLSLDFYAIDNCIIYQHENGNKKSTCDAAIKIENKQLYFIELKDRRSSGWLSKATNQLKSTLKLYRDNEISLVNKIECYVCNPQRPSAPSSTLGLLKKFRRDTGCNLNVSHKVNIQIRLF